MNYDFFYFKINFVYRFIYFVFLLPVTVFYFSIREIDKKIEERCFLWHGKRNRKSLLTKRKFSGSSFLTHKHTLSITPRSKQQVEIWNTPLFGKSFSSAFRTFVWSSFTLYFQDIFPSHFWFSVFSFNVLYIFNTFPSQLNFS